MGTSKTQEHCLKINKPQSVSLRWHFFWFVFESLSDFIFSDVSNPQMLHQPVMFQISQRSLMSQLLEVILPTSRNSFVMFFLFTFFYSILFEHKEHFAAEEDARPTLGAEPLPTPPRGSVSCSEPSNSNLSPPPLPSLKALPLIFRCALNQEGHFSASRGRDGGATGEAQMI